MADPEDEQSREERLEIARRYRERRGRELRELAAPCLEGEVEAAGEFSSVPKEAIAAVPFVGVAMVPWARWRARKVGLPVEILIALDHDSVHILDIGAPDGDVSSVKVWPRAAVRVISVRSAFMRSVVTLDAPDRDEDLTLYAPSLRTNPWSSEVVRLLGGEAPEPLDLGSRSG